MWFTQTVIWKVQGLLQSNDAAYLMQQEDKETTQKQTNQQRKSNI